MIGRALALLSVLLVWSAADANIIQAPTGASPPPSSTTWDPVNCGSGLALSSGNTVATAGLSATLYNCRSTTTRTGKLYFRIQPSVVSFNYDWAADFANSSFAVTGTASNLAHDVNAIGCFNASGLGPGTLYYNSVNIANCSDTVMDGHAAYEVAIDTTTARMWSRNVGDTQWNNNATADPVAEVGGVTLSFTGPYFIAISLANGNAATLIPHPTGCPAPSGYSCWDP